MHPKQGEGRGGGHGQSPPIAVKDSAHEIAGLEMRTFYKSYQ